MIKGQYILCYNDKGVKKGRKQRYLLYTHTQIQQNKEEMLMTTTVLISETDHTVVVGIYNYLLPLPIPYSLCPQQASELVMVFCLLG